MKPAPASGVDQVGVNILRIVTGTYFMALALDLIKGFDPTALFRPVMGATGAEATGAILLLALSIWFMLGAALRIAALSAGRAAPPSVGRSEVFEGAAAAEAAGDAAPVTAEPSSSE